MSFESSSSDDQDRLSSLRGSLGRALSGLLVVLALGAIAYVLIRRSRGGAQGRARTDAVIVGLYRELDRALQKQGHPRGSAATPLEHARELRARGLPYSQDVQRVTDCYVASRYGDHVPSAEELAQIKDAIARVRSAETAHLKPGQHHTH
jgi:hypothetical protein